MNANWRQQALAVRAKLLSIGPTLAGFGLVASALTIYLSYPNWIGEDLSGNLLAESIGILVTVWLIQWLIQANERRKTQAPRFQTYQEAVRLHMMICSTWATIVRSTIVDPPDTGEDLFSHRYIQEVQLHFNVDGNPGQLPVTTWRIHLAQWHNDLKSRIDRVIQRYQSTFDPELLDLLARVEEMPTLAMWGQMARLQPLIAQHQVYAQQGLLFVDGFEEREVALLRKLHARLIVLAKEFVRIEGFIHPYDITFAKEILSMRTRDDIAPRRGSCRR